MSRQKITDVDFHFGVGMIIPSTQEAFHQEFSGAVRQLEKEELAKFRVAVGPFFDEPADKHKFPSDREIFIFIIQYFVSEKKYRRRDIDNMAKTVLDLLKGKIYRDDSQVKTLLVGKKMEQRVPQDFAYVAIRELSHDKDVDALKISGVERSVTLFQELKSKGLI